MNFASALISMEQNKCVRRSHWKGYWTIENGTIMIHLSNGNTIDIRSTEDPIFTAKNMACDDWEIADPSLIK